MTEAAAVSPPALPIEKVIAQELAVTRDQVWSAIKLLDSGATVPFIARYRKEATGGLTDTHLRLLSDRLEYLRDLEKRRIEVFQAIEDQGKLTDSLKALIAKAETKAALEDIYLPFRPKKNSKAQAARDMGLEPLADKILNDPSVDPETAAKDFVNPDKAVADTAVALAGAREILADRFSDDTELVVSLRTKFLAEGWVHSSVAEKSPLSSAVSPEEAAKFTDYFNFRQKISEIPSHRLLAILRGRKENILRMSMHLGGFYEDARAKRDEDAEPVLQILKRFNIEPKRRAADAWLLETARQCWRYKIRIRLEIDILSRLREKAEEEAIRVFAENLRNLLLAAPAGPRATLGLDPGFRTGVKVAVVDKTGKALETGAIFPHAPQNEWEKSLRALAALVKKYNIELISIGNGTASRETEKLASELIKNNPDLKVQKAVVSEAGASVYSASELASQELPGMDVSYRGAVSIARRLQDPLAELVKIDPKAIGVGQYQHDVNQSRLGKMLREVVEDCVNAVGVDVNTASAAVLSYISGLTRRTAENVVAYRNTHGLFRNRSEFLSVPDFGPRAFEQSAGFLRIAGGDNPLDRSAVHPESYAVVEKILAACEKNMSDILGNADLLDSLDPETFADDKFGVPTVIDILEELEKPGRDPRPEFKTAVFREDVTELSDLKPGMTLEGTVTNVAAFGAFVDIGVHQDGLVHISELSNEFVRDPHAVVKTGQVVRVRVIEIDIPRRRIALSMKKGVSMNRAPRLAMLFLLLAGNFVLFCGMEVMEHREELGTLKAQAGDEAEKDKISKAHEEAFQKVAAAMTAGEIKIGALSKDIRARFGAPSVADAGEGGGQRWLYRSLKGRNALDKPWVFLYFDSKGILTRWDCGHVQGCAEFSG